MKKEYEAMPGIEENQKILGEIYIILALISIIRQDFEFEALFNMAESCLPGGSVLVDYSFNIAEGINICGIKNPVPGELKKYLDALFRVMPSASKIMNGCGYGAEYLNAAYTYYMTGDIQSAEKYAYQAIFHAQQKQQYGIECMANFILVRIYVLKGDFSKVLAVFNQMKEQVNSHKNSEALSLYDIIRGWFFVKIGEIGKVPKWILREEDTRKKLAPVIVGREYLVRSDSLLAEGRYYELLAFMEQQDKMYTERGVLYAVIQNKITRAIIYYYMDKPEESIKVLNEAYELSSPNNLIIQYIEYGNQMRTVIHAARQNENCKIPRAWLDNIYTKSSTYAKWLARIIAEYKRIYLLEDKSHITLSKREKEVLVCLGAGLTRDEIALHCNISINTVKSIIKNILNKLGALNSIEAVRIATEMRLI